MPDGRNTERAFHLDAIASDLCSRARSILGLFDDAASTGKVAVIEDLGRIWNEQLWPLALAVVVLTSQLLIATDRTGLFVGLT